SILISVLRYTNEASHGVSRPLV
ncbi:uncharacterized protein J3R85_020379, partial [Psidium guajava]